MLQTHSIEFNYIIICKALYPRYSLKGLSRPYIYDTLPDPSPPEGKKKTPLNSKEESRDSPTHNLIPHPETLVLIIIMN
jgi:hypothetical protein